MKIASVIIIDDDAFVRSSLTAALNGFGLNVVGTGQTFSVAMSLCKTNPVDVAIIDFDLGHGPNGFDICVALRKQFPEIGLVLLTSYTDLNYAEPNLPSLPKGTRFITKSNLSDFQLLTSAILSAKHKPLETTKTFRKKSQLTITQIEVLRMLSEGLSTNEIANRRGVSIKAVEGIISKIHNKLGLEKSKSLNQRVQLARAFFNLSGKNLPHDS